MELIKKRIDKRKHTKERMATFYDTFKHFYEQVVTNAEW